MSLADSSLLAVKVNSECKMSNLMFGKLKMTMFIDESSQDGQVERHFQVVLSEKLSCKLEETLQGKKINKSESPAIQPLAKL